MGLGGSISQLDSVWQYCLAIIRCFRMNGIDPLLTTFVSYCVRGRSRGGQTCESGCLILFFIPMTSAFVSRHPGNVTPHYSTLRCFRKCPLFSLHSSFFFFLKLTQNCSWSPSCYKGYFRPRHGSQVQCNLAYPNLCSGFYKWPNIVQTWSTAAWTREFGSS